MRKVRAGTLPENGFVFSSRWKWILSSYCVCGKCLYCSIAAYKLALLSSAGLVCMQKFLCSYNVCILLHFHSISALRCFDAVDISNAYYFWVDFVSFSRTCLNIAHRRYCSPIGKCVITLIEKMRRSSKKKKLIEIYYGNNIQKHSSWQTHRCNVQQCNAIQIVCNEKTSLNSGISFHCMILNKFPYVNMPKLCMCWIDLPNIAEGITKHIEPLEIFFGGNGN